jgi:hypothetical protein
MLVLLGISAPVEFLFIPLLSQKQAPPWFWSWEPLADQALKALKVAWPGLAQKVLGSSSSAETLEA